MTLDPETDRPDFETVMAELARSRSSSYALFAAVFVRPPDKGFLSCLLSPGVGALPSSMACRGFEDLPADDETVEALAVEYTSLFVGPGQHLTPCESVWRGGGGLLWGESTAQVKGFIENSGLRFQPDWSGLPDHVSVEFEFMGRLCSHEAGLWGAVRRPHDALTTNGALSLSKGAAERLADLRMCLDTEEGFLSDHLLAWVPSFCDRVAERGDGYYGQMARLAKDFLASDIEHVRQAVRRAAGRTPELPV